MAEPFLSEIRLFSFSFPPRGWARCDGQLLPINQNQALFSLLGTIYGGDGRVNFGLPDLRGRVPLHVGSEHVIGQRGGAASHTLSIAEMPQHQHLLQAAPAPATTSTPGTTVMLAQSSGATIYGPPTNPEAMSATAVGVAGGSQAHLNMQPFLTLNFSIALQGIFPSPS